jgi:hypothetical protein
MIKKPIILFIAAALIIAGCNFPGSNSETTKTSQADEVQSAIQTALANAMTGLTQTAAAGKPTTEQDKVNTPAPVVIPTLGNTQPVVVKPSGSDSAALVSETIPDDTKVLPGKSFTKTWRIMNNGTSSWSTDYKLVFVEGEQMGAAKEYRMPIPVDAGKIIDLSIDMTAPATAGTYKGFWKIKNPNGTLFGSGGTSSFWVKIVVTPATPTPTLPPTGTATSTTVPPTATPTASQTPG